MSVAETFEAWKDRIAYSAVGAIVLWLSWLTIAFITQPEPPYIHDRKYVTEKIREWDETKATLMRVIERNTDAINGLRVEMAALREALKKE